MTYGSQSKIKTERQAHHSRIANFKVTSIDNETDCEAFLRAQCGCPSWFCPCRAGARVLTENRMLSVYTRTEHHC